MKCPPFSSNFIVTDDARLAAQLSCVKSKRGYYLPVSDGPRMSRNDDLSEIAFRYNACILAKAQTVYLTGLPKDSEKKLRELLANRASIECVTIGGEEAIIRACGHTYDELPALSWGQNCIGLGLLQALRSNRRLCFTDEESSEQAVSSLSGHLVVCQKGDDVSEVVAANYAFSLGAGLALIKETSRAESDDILERFYSFDAACSARTRHEVEHELRQTLLELCGPLTIPSGGSITFIGSLPFGFAFSEVPTTHLFAYPNLGLSVVHGFAAEQPGTHGTGVVSLVDPDTTPAPEIEAAAKALASKRAFIRAYQGRGADVRSISDMVEHFPYDLLIIATHCGDVSGYRWTYEFRDSEGIDRTLVVDIGIGIAQTKKNDRVRVSQFMRFVSLDGFDWNDPEEKKKLNVGVAIRDFCEMIEQSDDKLEPVKKETTERVIGSSALRMFGGHDYIMFSHTIADFGHPIVINNACVSWHRLAGSFMFAGCRAYVGTLFTVLPSEAVEILGRVLDKHMSKHLPIALWAAQRDVYGTDSRRPYVVSGVFPQQIRVKHSNYPAAIKVRLARSLAFAKKRLLAARDENSRAVESYSEIAEYYERELRHFIRTYPD